jgi:hypothetical protein
MQESQFSRNRLVHLIAGSDACGAQPLCRRYGEGGADCDPTAATAWCSSSLASRADAEVRGGADDFTPRFAPIAGLPGVIVDAPARHHHAVFDR